MLFRSNIIHEAINASTKRNINVDPIVGQLERLEAMLNRGSITQSEFDEQKRRLLLG